MINKLNADASASASSSNEANPDENVSMDSAHDNYTFEESSTEEHDPDREAFKNIEKKNREKLLSVLTNMACTPKEDRHHNIGFTYQGENFVVIFNGLFIRIWDPSWFSIKPTDDDFTLIKDATNYANFAFGPTIVTHSPDEDGKIVFSSRIDIPLVNQSQNLKGYLEAVLDSFFSLKQNLSHEFNRLKTDPQDRTLHDNPIGFDTASLSDPHSPHAN